jgi:hypothetical protein
LSDIRLHEIVTCAVVGRGDRRVVWSHAAPADGAESVLGVHVSHVNLSVEEDGGEAALRIKSTCDLWCSCGDETRVHRLTCVHTEPCKVKLHARCLGETETKARLVRDVRCVVASIEDGKLCLTLEADVCMEVTGMSRFWVKCYDVDPEESGDMLSDSSSCSSSFSCDDLSGSVSHDGELSEEEDYASVRSAVRPEPPAVPPERVTREQPSRRASVISHFQQSNIGSRVSIVQGH